MMRNGSRNFLFWLALAFLAARGSVQAQLSDRHDKVALSSEVDPFGDDYGFIDDALLNDTGLTTFTKPAFLTLAKIYQGTIAKVARGIEQGTLAPSGGVFAGFDSIDVNGSGHIAFKGFTNSTSGLYLSSQTAIKSIALKDAPAPGGGVFNIFSEFFSVNDSGQVAFQATTTGGPGDGIYLYTGSGVVSLEQIGKPAPGGGLFTSFGSTAVVNTSGQVAFTATTDTPSDGLYLISVSESHRLANVAVTEFSLNDVGQVAFVAGSAIHLATTSGDTVIVTNGDPAPGGGTFESFDNVLVNEGGHVVFRATTNGGPGSGIYLWTPNGLKSIALNAGLAPGGGLLSSFGVPVLNNAGQVVFAADADGNRIICLGDETDLLKVIAFGDSLLGVTITNVSLAPPRKAPGHGPVNDFAQIAYRADFTNGVTGIFIFTPSVHWRTAGSGAWDDAANWTASIKPGLVHDVAIDPAVGVTVIGPAADTTVRSLRVGDGAGAATLDLQAGATVATTAGLTVAANGTLSGTGTIGGNLTLLAGADVALEIAGPTRGIDYDFLKITGRSVLSGTLTVSVTNGLILHGGDTFDLFDWGAKAGKFLTVNLPALPPGLTWDTSKLYTTGAVTVSMATFFAANQGKYSGLVTADPAAFASTGSIALTLTQGGAFTGTLKMGGKSFAVRGALDDTGYFSGAIGNSGFSLILQLDLNNPTDQIAATIKQNGAAFSVSTLNRIQTGFTAKNPVPLAGAYTVALPADPNHPEATYPQGTGCGSLVVTPTGTVKLTGVLGDFTAASPTGILSKNNEFSVYVALYGGKGFLSGVLTLHEEAAPNHVTGTLDWFKPATSAAAYPGSFAGEITVIGSHYTVPPTPPSPPQILPLGPATFTISGGNVLVNPSVKNLTIGPGNTVMVTPAEKFTLKITTKTGIFAGTFLDTTNKSRAFKGAFLQKQNVGKGVFKGDNQTGKIELQP